MEFIGRVDDQVKIRGFRIELGEIETRLSELPSVLSSVVLVTGESNEQKQLVAYVVPADEVSDEGVWLSEIKQQLKSELPDYMVPTLFVLLDKFPLTVNGKIDKKALPAPDGTLLQGEYVAAQTDTEKALVSIWSELLGIDADKISVTANFFELGGHSLLVVRLVASIRSQLQAELSVKSVFETPTVYDLSALVNAAEPGRCLSNVIPVSRQLDGEPVSFSQQRLWFIDQLQGGSSEYNMPVAFNVRGDFDLAIANKVMQRIIARHEVLRTVLKNTATETVQVIRETVEFAFSEYDVSALPVDEQGKAVQKLASEDAIAVFNLSEDVMVRGGYIHLSTEGELAQGVMLFNMHHIASDGWSIGVLVNEFVSLYEAFSKGHADPLPPLGIQYVDYAHWQHMHLKGDLLDAQLSYWQTQLDEVAAVHGLPLDFTRPKVKTHQGALVSGALSSGLSQELKQLAQANGMTLFMLLHAAIGLVLSRHSNNQDIVLGTPVANRPQAELAPLIGFFVNTLVLRTNTQHEHLADYLAHVRQVNLDAQSNQDVPFEQLVELCQVPRSTAHSPLFQIMFSMDTNEQSDLRIDGLTFSPLASEVVTAKFDLEINASGSEEGIIFSWLYDSGLFKPERMAQMQEHLETLLQGMVAAPQGGLAELPMLSDKEIHHLVHELNDTECEYPQDKLIHELFEAQAEETPDNVALVFEDTELTYAQLNARANQLAHYLREKGVGPDVLVGICLERSLEMVISILAVLKAGGAYVPLEPDYPAARLDYMLEDAGLSMVITQTHLRELVSLTESQAVCLDDDVLKAQLNTFGINNLVPDHVGVNSQHLAYVIYTSGSTGQPKGVAVRHKNTCSMLYWANANYSDVELSHVLASTSLKFD